MVCFVKKAIFFAMDEGVFVFFVELNQIFDNLFCVYMNARFLFVYWVGENDYVHGGSLALFRNFLEIF